MEDFLNNNTNSELTKTKFYLLNQTNTHLSEELQAIWSRYMFLQSHNNGNRAINWWKLLNFFASTLARSTRAQLWCERARCQFPSSPRTNQIGRFREFGKLIEALRKKKRKKKRNSAYPKAYTNYTKFISFNWSLSHQRSRLICSFTEGLPYWIWWSVANYLLQHEQAIFKSCPQVFKFGQFVIENFTRDIELIQYIQYPLAKQNHGP